MIRVTVTETVASAGHSSSRLVFQIELEAPGKEVGSAVEKAVEKWKKKVEADHHDHDLAQDEPKQEETGKEVPPTWMSGKQEPPNAE